MLHATNRFDNIPGASTADSLTSSTNPYHNIFNDALVEETSSENSNSSSRGTADSNRSILLGHSGSPSRMMMVGGHLNQFCPTDEIGRMTVKTASQTKMADTLGPLNIMQKQPKLPHVNFNQGNTYLTNVLTGLASPRGRDNPEPNNHLPPQNLSVSSSKMIEASTDECSVNLTDIDLVAREILRDNRLKSKYDEMRNYLRTNFTSSDLRRMSETNNKRFGKHVNGHTDKGSFINMPDVRLLELEETLGCKHSEMPPELKFKNGSKTLNGQNLLPLMYRITVPNNPTKINGDVKTQAFANPELNDLLYKLEDLNVRLRQIKDRKADDSDHSSSASSPNLSAKCSTTNIILDAFPFNSVMQQNPPNLYQTDNICDTGKSIINVNSVGKDNGFENTLENLKKLYKDKEDVFKRQNQKISHHQRFLRNLQSELSGLIKKLEDTSQLVYQQSHVSAATAVAEDDHKTAEVVSSEALTAELDMLNDIDIIGCGAGGSPDKTTPPTITKGHHLLTASQMNEESNYSSTYPFTTSPLKNITSEAMSYIVKIPPNDTFKARSRTDVVSMITSSSSSFNPLGNSSTTMVVDSTADPRLKSGGLLSTIKTARLPINVVTAEIRKCSSPQIDNHVVFSKSHVSSVSLTTQQQQYPSWVTTYASATNHHDSDFYFPKILSQEDSNIQKLQIAPARINDKIESNERVIIQLDNKPPPSATTTAVVVPTSSFFTTTTTKNGYNNNLVSPNNFAHLLSYSKVEKFHFNPHSLKSIRRRHSYAEPAEHELDENEEILALDHDRVFYESNNNEKISSPFTKEDLINHQYSFVTCSSTNPIDSLTTLTTTTMAGNAFYKETDDHHEVSPRGSMKIHNSVSSTSDLVGTSSIIGYHQPPPPHNNTIKSSSPSLVASFEPGINENHRDHHIAPSSSLSHLLQVHDTRRDNIVSLMLNSTTNNNNHNVNLNNPELLLDSPNSILDSNDVFDDETLVAASSTKTPTTTYNNTNKFPVSYNDWYHQRQSSNNNNNNRNAHGISNPLQDQENNYRIQNIKNFGPSDPSDNNYHHLDHNNVTQMVVVSSCATPAASGGQYRIWVSEDSNNFPPLPPDNILTPNEKLHLKSCLKQTKKMLPASLLSSPNHHHTLPANKFNSPKWSLNNTAPTYDLQKLKRVTFDPLALLLDAALEGEYDLVVESAKKTPNPSASNDEGITALHNAICAGHMDIVMFLIEYGCDINAPDSDGWTPLHCAASCNNFPMLTFLVEHGASVFAETLSDKETPLHKCELNEYDFQHCAAYLYHIERNTGVINNGKVFALYEYVAQENDELSFKLGDELWIVGKSTKSSFSHTLPSKINSNDQFDTSNVSLNDPKLPNLDNQTQKSDQISSDTKNTIDQLDSNLSPKSTYCDESDEDDEENDWWLAKNSENLIGLVPKNYVGIYKRVEPQYTISDS